MTTIKEWIEACHALAKYKGFWDQERNVGELLMLVVSELSEALEAYRLHDAMGFKLEIADTLIRLFDLCGGLELDDIEQIMQDKIEVNKRRPYMHGKRC